MKAIIRLLIVPFIFQFSFAQVDCKPFVPTKKGTQWEISNFSGKKGKSDGKIGYELVDKIVDGNNVTFIIKYTTYDKKGNQIYSGSYEAKCIDGIFDLDMAVKLDGAQLQAYQDMDVNVDASTYELPDLDSAPNTELADGTLKVSVAAGGGLNINMNVDITERKVEKRETIETKAGTFDCIVVFQKVSTKTILKVQGYSREWYAPFIGLVRSESFNKNMKRLAFSEITMLKEN